MSYIYVKTRLCHLQVKEKNNNRLCHIYTWKPGYVIYKWKRKSTIGYVIYIRETQAMSSTSETTIGYIYVKTRLCHLQVKEKNNNNKLCHIYTWKPGYVIHTWTTVYVIYTWKPDYVSYTWKPDYVIFTWKPVYVIYTWTPVYYHIVHLYSHIIVIIS